MKNGIKNDPEIRRVMGKYPRTFDFIKKRLTPNEEFGLYLTVGIVITLIFAYLFLSVLVGLFTQDILIMSDLRVINIAVSFRAPKLDQFMFFITILGDKGVIIPGAAALSIFLYSLRRWRYSMSLLASVVFGEAFIWVVKHTVERARPPIAVSLLKEDGYSFPSGHAFIAMAFYGLIGYFVYRGVKGRMLKTLVALGFAILVGLIGYSRIYLGVHWPSDVLASFAAGAAWITVFITALEIRRKFGQGLRARHISPSPRLEPTMFDHGLFLKNRIKKLGVVLFLAWAVLVVLFWKHEAETNPLVYKQNEEQTINIGGENLPEDLFRDFPRVSETISGKPQEPINIIIVGSSEEQLGMVFRKAGWLECDRLNSKNLWRLIAATMNGRPYPTAPGVPSIWNDQPNEISFEKPSMSVKEREHIHLWNTPFLVSGKGKVWFGTAHFDQTIKLKSSIVLPTHTIDPAIDKERDKIKDELVKTDCVDSYSEYQIVDPTMGKNQVGDLFFTDGKAYIFFMKPET